MLILTYIQQVVLAAESELTLTPKPETNNIHLKWTGPQNSSYKVYQKKPGATQFETIGLTDFSNNATDEEVKEAARLANCIEFIEAQPEGFNTVIGENGNRLSGGERQRLSIARALLKDAPIIILDEISASLDVENEMKIQESLNALIKNKTVIIISHRLKSIENVDKIVVMNKGKIDAEGTHAELLKESSLYRDMIEKSGLTETYTY